MLKFVIDETHLLQLSTDARRELLQVLDAEFRALRREVAAEAWNPDGDISYPLTAEEARALVRSLAESERRLLRAFCRDTDDDVGRADLVVMLEAAGCTNYTELGEEVNRITQRLHGMTGDKDAWLFNWHAEDWEWDEQQENYLRGQYFISGPAIDALRQAFSIKS